MINVDHKIPENQSIESKEDLPITNTWDSLTTAVSASMGQFKLTSQFNSKNNAYNDSFKIATDKLIKEDSDNEPYYNAYTNATNAHKRIFEDLYKRGRIYLDNGEIKAIGGEAKHYAIERENSIKGYLLGLNKGLNPKGIRGEAEEKVFKEYQELDKELQRTTGAGGAIGNLVGTMGGAISDPVFLATLPLGAPAIGRGIAMNAGKAFGQEFLIGTATESVIQTNNYNFKNRIGLDYDLTDLAIDSLMAGTAGGVIRAGGSIAVDTNILRKAKWNKETFDRFERITYGTKSDRQIDTLDAMNKVYQDKMTGDTVNIDKITDDAPTTVDNDLQGQSMFRVADNDFQKLEMPDDDTVKRIEELGYNTKIKPELEELDIELSNIEKGLSECLS